MDSQLLQKSVKMLTSSANSVFQFSIGSASRLRLFGDEELGLRAGQESTFFLDKSNEGLKTLSHLDSFESFNWPLLLIGSSGNGKTSIGCALSAEIADRGQGKLTVFSATNFRRRFDNAIETNSTHQFFENVLSSDAIFIDGLQELRGYEKIQLELCTLLDLADTKAIPAIFTFTGDSDSLAESLLPRLISRLSSGLCFPIRNPGLDVRRVMVQSICTSLGLSVDSSAIQFLADKLDLPFPRIRSFLNHFLIWSKSNPTEVSEVVSVPDVVNYLRNYDSQDVEESMD